ncbi:MAG: hypothetical protein KDD11_20970, partial [Acidobacteria bacterium]|nr:hypothetical protein [Acidobacteriota bacterium]
MGGRLRFFVLGVAVLMASASAVLAADALTNDDVVQMVGLGLGEDLIIAKINQAPEVSFELEVNDLVGLREKGVSERIVQEMLTRSTATRPEPTAPAQQPTFSADGAPVGGYQ